METTVKLLKVGLFVTYDGKSWYILSSQANEEIDPNSTQSAAKLPETVMTVKYLLLRVSDEGDDLGELPIWVNGDEVEVSA